MRIFWVIVFLIAAYGALAETRVIPNECDRPGNLCQGHFAGAELESRHGGSE